LTLGQAFVVVRGLLYSAAFIALWMWVAASVRVLDPRIPFSIPSWLAPLGSAMACLGGLIAALCIASFVTRGRGTPAPFDPPRAFVASGPYRFVRNPMYIGAASALVGGGLALSSPAIFLLGFAFLALMHLVVVLHEEPSLTDKFGDSYRSYRETVHRWLPRLPPG
jgi:protein-S-isoprenylcysteine O-methyltransferase Ste14